jgi:hypothetical protein
VSNQWFARRGFVEAVGRRCAVRVPLQIPPLRSCGAPVGMTRGGRFTFRKRRDSDRQSQEPLLRETADPLRSCGAPVGMTRGGRLRSGRGATRMDRVRCRHSAPIQWKGVRGRTKK